MSIFRYCVLWIPTRLHQKIRPISHELDDRGEEPFTREFKKDQYGLALIEESISLRNILASDEANTKVYLDFTLLKEGVCMFSKTKKEFADTTCSCFIPKRDIQIEARLEDGTVFDTLYLHCLDARRNGLFMYEYEVQDKYLEKTNSEENYLLNSNKNVTNILYHSIKSFYHVHEFHSGDQDSIFHPFSSDVKINLNSPNNPALLHYLDEFEKIFNDEDDYTMTLKARADKVYKELKIEEINLNLNENKVLLRNAIEHIKTGYIECINQCDSVLNMHVYYQALFYSKHNTMFNLRYVDSYQYELSEVCQATGKKRKSALTLKSYNNNTNTPQLIVPNGFRKSTSCILSNECYKKAINIHNAIESISLRQKEVSNRVNWTFLKFIDNLINELYIQTGDIKKQSVEIQDQARKVEDQTIQIKELTTKTGELSSKLTIKTALIGIVVGIISSLGFYLLSSNDYSPKDDIKTINGNLTDTKKQLQKQIGIHNQQMEDVKKLLLDLNSEVKKKQENKKTHTKVNSTVPTVKPQK